MYQYFAFNIIYSVIVFMYLYSLKTAPFRIRFRFVMSAMVSWLLPYDLINSYLTQDNAIVISSTIANFNGTIKNAIVSQIDSQTYITLLSFITVITFFGLAWFIKDYVSLKIKLQNLSKQSSLYKNIGGCEIYKTNNDEIFTVGLLKPKIYIGEKYLNSPFTDSIIKHELQHCKTHDQLWLLLITFVQRLLWWNPIVYLLAIKARELLELSCDQACKKQSKDNKYQKDLAQILIQTNQHSNPLASNFFGRTKHNIFRIKQLSKELKMNKKHKALIFSTAFIPFVLMLFVSTASISSEEAKLIDDNIEVKLANNEIDLTFKVSFIKYQENHETTGSVTKTNTQSIEARLITKYDKATVLEDDKLDFELHATPKYIDDSNVLIAFKIIYTTPNGETVTKTPSIITPNEGKAKMELTGDEKENYKIEIEVLPRF